MDDSERIDPRTVVEWDGFIAEVDGDMLHCRMSDLDADHGDEDYMAIHKETFMRLLRESQPDRAEEFEDREFPLGLIFHFKVDGDAGLTTLTLPPPWTEKEIEERKAAAEDWLENIWSKIKWE